MSFSTAHLVHDIVGQVVGEHVKDEAISSREFEVVETPGAHLSHQDRPGAVDNEDYSDDDDDDYVPRSNNIGKQVLDID